MNIPPSANEIKNNFYTKTNYVGYTYANSVIQAIFSNQTVELIQREVMKLLTTREKYFPDKDYVLSTLNAQFNSFTPPVNNNSTFAQINPNERFSSEKYIQRIIGDTIDKIANEINSSIAYKEALANYTIWDTVYGEHNRRGLRYNAPITKEIKNRDIDRGQIHMRY